MHGIPIWALVGRTHYAQLFSKTNTQKFFHLNIRMNVPLTLKENFTLKCTFS